MTHTPPTMTATEEISQFIKQRYPDGVRRKELYAIANPEEFPSMVSDKMMYAIIRNLETQVNEAIATGAKCVHLDWVNTPSEIGIFGRAYDQVMEKQSVPDSFHGATD